MGKAIRVLGKKKGQPIYIPQSDILPTLDRGNSIMQVRYYSGWIHYFAIGVVVKIYKNDKFDVAYINCGLGGIENNNNIKIYFLQLNARKQVYTLKVGQFAMFGLFRHKDMQTKSPNHYIVDWAMGIYVPKVVDIRNSELSENEIEEMTEDDLMEGQSFLDLFDKNE